MSRQQRFSKKSIDAAVYGLAAARAVLDGAPAPNPPSAPMIVDPRRDRAHIVDDEPPLLEPDDDWNQTRRDLG